MYVIVYLPIFDSLKFKVQGHSRFQGRLLEPGQHIINRAKMICKIAKEKKTKLYFLCFLALTNYFQMFSATDGYHGKGNHLIEAKFWSVEPLFVVGRRSFLVKKDKKHLYGSVTF